MFGTYDYFSKFSDKLLKQKHKNYFLAPPDDKSLKEIKDSTTKKDTSAMIEEVKFYHFDEIQVYFSIFCGF